MERTEAALAKARHLAAFIRYEPKTALFVGLYPVAGWHRITIEQQMTDPAHQELIAHGLTGDMATRGRDTLLRFDLPRSDWHADWRGRLIVRWPGLERSWYRWADRSEFAIEAIALESLLVQPMPGWDQLSIGWGDLAVLPRTWRARLAEWRGVYLITDADDRRQYVGSAYGHENLLQRWSEYARSGHGGNKLLRGRDPARFNFSILQRVSPDMPEAEVVAVERSWKLRLRTLAPDGLNEN